MQSLEIDAHAAQTLLGADAPPRLIDCREPDEFAICKIDGAELIPLSTFAETFREKLSDLAQPIVIYCHHGMRSLRAAEFLASSGYSNVRSLRGGIDGWSEQIDPAVPRY